MMPACSAPSGDESPYVRILPVPASETNARSVPLRRPPIPMRKTSLNLVHAVETESVDLSRASSKCEYPTSRSSSPP